MTVSLPVTLPAPAVAGKAGSAAPAKGVASAPGQQAKAAGNGAEAAEVAGMFAALIAALTEQMQAPITPQGIAADEGTTAETAEGQTPQIAVAPFVSPVAGATKPDVSPPVATAPMTAQELVIPVADGADPAPDLTVAPPAIELDGETPAASVAGEVAEEIEVTTVPTDGDGDAADAAAPAATRAARAVPDERSVQPATPATPTTPSRAGARTSEDRPVPPGGAIPATPAQPAAGTVPVTPAAPATPPAKSGEQNVGPLAATSGAPLTTPAAAPVEAAAPAAPPAPAADAHVQIARIVRPLRLGNDGAYELALDLTPAELGRVRIDVELRGATIHLSLRADNAATRELLQSSLGQLRAELEGAGLQAGNLDVGGQRPDGREAAADETASLTSPVLDEEPAATAETTPSPTSETATDAGVDVLA